MQLFNELGLNEKILQAIDEMGFKSPTPIQQQAIPIVIDGETDLIGLAQTGTGKTAAFGLPMLHLIDTSLKKPQALVLCPTRELCLQITNDLKNFSKYMSGTNIVAVYGGASIVTQLKEIKQGVQIIVATPGRLIDIIGRGVIDFTNTSMCVLDEADEMLNMGFQEDIDLILSKTPSTKKTWLFSATMPAEVRRIASKYMTSPKEITVGSKNTGNANIEHEYYIVRSRDKYAALKRVVDFNPDIFGIIFTRTKIESQEIAEHLMKDGYNADALHGDLSQQQRDRVMQRFREKSIQILVATDVAARGIDVDNVTHVINYSIPDDNESYTHRSGRTARAGKTGVSLSIINSKETWRIRQLEKQVGKSFTQAQVPTGFDVCEKQLFSLIHRVHNVEVNEQQIEQYMQRIYDEFADMSKEEVIKRFASLEFNRFLNYYRTAPDLNAADEKGSSSRERGERNREDRDRSNNYGSNAGFTRLFVNIGSVDDLQRGDLLRFVCDNANVPGAKVGRIDIKGVYSFIDVDSSITDTVLGCFKGVEYNGRQVRAEVSQESAGNNSSKPRRRDDHGGGYGGGGNRRSGGSGGGYGGKKKRY